jgi:hypothetical protein
VQEILESYCKVFELESSPAVDSNLSSYMVVAWTMHPYLIPTEVRCVVPESEEPSMVGQRQLFLHASEIIHSKQDNSECSLSCSKSMTSPSQANRR